MSVVGSETPLTSRRLRCPAEIEWKESGIEDQDRSGDVRSVVEGRREGGLLGVALMFESASSGREGKTACLDAAGG